MTTLMKTAEYEYEPGTPLVPAVPPTIECRGFPDPYTPSTPPVPVTGPARPGWPFDASTGGGGGGAGSVAVNINGVTVVIPTNTNPDSWSKRGG